MSEVEPEDPSPRREMGLNSPQIANREKLLVETFHVHVDSSSLRSDAEQTLHATPCRADSVKHCDLCYCYDIKYANVKGASIYLIYI